MLPSKHLLLIVIIGLVTSSCRGYDPEFSNFSSLFKGFIEYGLTSKYGGEKSRFNYRSYPRAKVYFPDKEYKNKSEVVLTTNRQHYSPIYTSIYLDKSDNTSELAVDLKYYTPSLSFAIEIINNQEIKLAAKNTDNDYLYKKFDLDWNNSVTFPSNLPAIVRDTSNTEVDQDGLTYYIADPVSKNFVNKSSRTESLLLSRTSNNSGFGIWFNEKTNLAKNRDELIIPFSYGYHSYVSDFYARFTKNRITETNGEEKQNTYQNILTYQGRTFAVAIDKELKKTKLTANITLQIHYQKASLYIENQRTAVMISSFEEIGNEGSTFLVGNKPLILRAEDISFPKPDPKVQRSYFIVSKLARSNNSSSIVNPSSKTFGSGELISEIYGQEGEVIGGTWYFQERVANVSYSKPSDRFSTDLYIMGSFGANLIREDATKKIGYK